MSEFTNTIEQRARILAEFMYRLGKGENGNLLVKEYNILNIKFIPKDIVKAFDYFFEKESDIEVIRQVSNKIFNLLYTTLKNYPALKPQKNTLLWFLQQDNEKVADFLQKTKTYIKEINRDFKPELLEKLKGRFERLLDFYRHYVVMQNVVFPALEANWENHQCLKLMWYIQDRVRQKIKETIDVLNAQQFDLKLFNKVSSAVYFDIYTIIHREELVLFPVILETISLEEQQKWLEQAAEIGLSFVDIYVYRKTQAEITKKDQVVYLSTGELTVEQIELIFNHLPVDITFVDKNDVVKYFSSPKERIFPRTKAIIGRKVQNCHPPDSVHIVNKIVNAFREGKQDRARFWIKMRNGKFVYIQYFAVRDEQGNYVGTLEVTQEISEIKALEGERRLLQWDE